MGIMNWIVQKTLIKEAQKTAQWAKKQYKEIKEKNPEVDEKEIHIRMFFDIDKFNNLKEKHKKYIETCCQTIEGLCYMTVMDFGKLKGFMNFRLLQFTKYMDHYLYSSGFNRQTKQQKEDILKAMDLCLENWEEITR